MQMAARMPPTLIAEVEAWAAANNTNGLKRFAGWLRSGFGRKRNRPALSWKMGPINFGHFAPGLARNFSRPREEPPGSSAAADGRVADAVAAGEIGQRLEAFVAACDRFAALVQASACAVTE